MSKLWLTYAWKDNEDDDVDHVISEITQSGLDVSYDRAELLAGRRLWDQIAENIKNPEISAWAIYVSENSLQSEPCLEELAYALDRTLRTRGSKFPLIGLFSGDFDRDKIPSALSTRLCINLHHNDWVQQIYDAVSGINSFDSKPTLPFGLKIHSHGEGFVMEVWPRTGTWAPFIAKVKRENYNCLDEIMVGPRGAIGRNGILMGAGAGSDDTSYWLSADNPVNSVFTAKIFLTRIPDEIIIGSMNGNMYHVKLDPA